MVDQTNLHMTKFLATIALCCALTISFSQENYTYSLTVFKQDQSPFSGCPVSIIETSSFKRKTFTTNGNGQVIIKIDSAGTWMLNVGDMRNYRKLNVPKGTSGSGKAIVTYDVDRWNRLNAPPTDRGLYAIDDIPQRLNYNAMPDKSHELFELQLLSDKKKPFYSIPVTLVCFENATSYSAYTDEQGIARFKLPLNSSFTIDIDGAEDFDYHDTRDKPYRIRETITYSRLNFEEVKNVDGDIEQFFKEAPKPISNRVMVTLTVVGGDKSGIHEDIYLTTDYTNERYHGKTNGNGQVAFLLPKKKSFHVNFKYQKDADVIDLGHFFGIGYMNQTIKYDPDPRMQFPERYLPTKNEVKSFDINNYNKKLYPDTEDDELLNVHVKWGNNKINSGSKEALLELGFSVKDIKDKKSISKPLNICFVLDKSGSMSGPKIDMLKGAMVDFIAKLRPEDRVGIVYFDTEAVLAYGDQKMDQNHLKDIVAALSAGGGTSIYEGLKLGYEQVSKNTTENSVNRVILLTDGYGSKPVDYILEQSEKYFKKGISVSTIGVGQGYNAALLSMISKFSGGLEHQAIESEGITKAMDKEFESLLYPLATDLKVKVKYNNKIIYKTLYGIPEAKNSDNMVQFNLEKVYSSLNRMALMKFKIENPDKDIDKNVISIEISYFDEQKKQPVKIIKQTHLEWTDETDAELIADRELKETYSIAVVNQAYKVLADLCDGLKYNDAKKTINQTLKSLKDVNSDKYTAELVPIIEELRGYLKALDRAIINGVK